jgi:hypothetical protein
VRLLIWLLIVFPGALARHGPEGDGGLAGALLEELAEVGGAGEAEVCGDPGGGLVAVGE